MADCQDLLEQSIALGNDKDIQALLSRKLNDLGFTEQFE
jgi:hypothetical protein